MKFDFGLKNKGMGLGLGIGMEISARSFAVLMIIEPYGILLGHHVLISLNVMMVKLDTIQVEINLCHSNEFSIFSLRRLRVSLAL